MSSVVIAIGTEIHKFYAVSHTVTEKCTHMWSSYDASCRVQDSYMAVIPQ